MACIRTHGVFGLDGDRMAFAEPGVGPNYAPDRTVVIEHLDVRLSIEPTTKAFTGLAKIRVRLLPTFTGVAAFDLDEVTVDAVSDEQGSALDWRHEGPELKVLGLSGPSTVVVRWHAEQPTRGLYFTGPTTKEPQRQHMAWTQCQDEDGHFVVPCHDHPGIKHPWSIELEGPAGYTLLSNGQQLDSCEENGRVIARFEQAEPMPAYLFTAVCARLVSKEATWRGKAVRYFVPLEEGVEAIDRSMGRTPEMIELFSTLTGREFPWPRYDQVVVHDFIFGGMENTGCTTMTRALLVDDKAALEWEADGLVSHELAHQWFGDLVTCQDWSQGWLNESWATYMELVWFEHSRTSAEAAWFTYETARAYFDPGTAPSTVTGLIIVQ